MNWAPHGVKTSQIRNSTNSSINQDIVELLNDSELLTEPTIAHRLAIVTTIYQALRSKLEVFDQV